MSLLLQWSKRNNTPVITEIYRSDTPIDRAALPAILVTLTNQETEFLDETAVTGQRYYYMWVNYNMQHKSPAYSSSVPIVVSQRRGVGSNTLITGDSNCGYFGDVTQTELCSAAQIMAMANAGSATLALTGWSFTWRKCIFKGKILFVPSQPQFLNSWQGIYRAGFVHGDFDRTKLPFAPTIDAALAIPQDRRITIAGDQYIIRMLRGYSDDLANVVPANLNTAAVSTTSGLDTVPTPYYFNEVDALWLGNTIKTPPLQWMPNYPDAVAPINGVRYGTICAEMVTTANILTRGGAHEVNSSNGNRTFMQAFRSTPSVSEMAVALILELVEG